MKYELVSDETIRSERADFAYEKIRLENGLTVLIAPMEGYRTANAAYATAFGSVDQKFRFEGREISLPAGVAEGQWLVKVTTQYAGSSGTLTKEPRSFELPRPVTVGATTTGGSTGGNDDDEDGNQQMG